MDDEGGDVWPTDAASSAAAAAAAAHSAGPPDDQWFQHINAFIIQQHGAGAFANNDTPSAATPFAYEAAATAAPAPTLPPSSQISGPQLLGPEGQWTPAADLRLAELVAKYEGKNWKAIAREGFGHAKTEVQCTHRWTKVLDPSIVKGAWTSVEDALLGELVKKYGEKDWSKIAEHIPGRIGKQCRERFRNHVDPSISRLEWTPEEDAILSAAHMTFGNSWAKIAQMLPGRPENSVKNYFNSTLSRRLNAAAAAAAAAASFSAASSSSSSSSSPAMNAAAFAAQLSHSLYASPLPTSKASNARKSRSSKSNAAFPSSLAVASGAAAAAGAGFGGAASTLFPNGTNSMAVPLLGVLNTPLLHPPGRRRRTSTAAAPRKRAAALFMSVKQSAPAAAAAPARSPPAEPSSHAAIAAVDNDTTERLLSQQWLASVADASAAAPRTPPKAPRNATHLLHSPPSFLAGATSVSELPLSPSTGGFSSGGGDLSTADRHAFRNFLSSPLSPTADDPRAQPQPQSQPRSLKRGNTPLASGLHLTPPNEFDSSPKRFRGDHGSAAASPPLLVSFDGFPTCACGALLLLNSDPLTPSSSLQQLTMSPLQCRPCASGQRTGSGGAFVSAISTSRRPRSLHDSFKDAATPTASFSSAPPAPHAIDQEQLGASGGLETSWPAMFPSRGPEAGGGAAAAAAAGPLHCGGGIRDPLSDISQQRLSYANAHKHVTEQHVQKHQHAALRARLQAVARPLGSAHYSAQNIPSAIPSIPAALQFGPSATSN